MTLLLMVTWYGRQISSPFRSSFISSYLRAALVSTTFARTDGCSTSASHAIHGTSSIRNLASFVLLCDFVTIFNLQYVYRQISVIQVGRRCGQQCRRRLHCSFSMSPRDCGDITEERSATQRFPPACACHLRRAPNIPSKITDQMPIAPE